MRQRVPVIGIDFGYNTDTSSPVLCHNCSRTGVVAAHALASKEVTWELVRRVVKDTGSMGHTKGVVKSRNKPAVKAIAGRNNEVRAPSTITEEALEYQAEASGFVEWCIQTAKRLFDTTRGALENRIGERMPGQHHILTWMVRHAAALHNRYSVGVEWRTPRERVARKMSAHFVAEFRERVMFLTKGLGKEKTWATSACVCRCVCVALGSSQIERGLHRDSRRRCARVDSEENRRAWEVESGRRFGGQGHHPGVGPRARRRRCSHEDRERAIPR